MKKLLISLQLFLIALLHVIALLPAHAATQEGPGAMARRISIEVVEAVAADKELRKGSKNRVKALVQTKIAPHVDFEYMTSLAVGRHWRTATPEQRVRLAEEFQALLVHTYSGALGQIDSEAIAFRPLREQIDGDNARVQLEVKQARGAEPVSLGFHMRKAADGWKVFDIVLLGVSLVETYKQTFTAEIQRAGVDGLIQTLVAKNGGNVKKGD